MTPRFPLAIALALVAGAPAAHAATIRVQSATSPVESLPAEVQHRVVITTRAAPERFRASLTDATPLAVLDGAATVTPLPAAAAAGAPRYCGGAFAALHRVAAKPALYDVQVAGSSRVTLAATRSAAYGASPSEIALRLSGSLTPLSADGAQIGSLRYLSSVAPPFTAPTGVDIVFRQAKPTTKPREHPVKHVRKGRSVVLDGSVTSALAGDFVQLWRIDMRTRRQGVFAQARIHPDLRWSWTWRPRATGRFEVFAAYQPQRPGFVRDTSECSLPVAVSR